jgi:hypothetical protein
MATVRRWAGLSWWRIHRTLFPTRREDEDAEGGVHRRKLAKGRRLVCLGIAHLCLVTATAPRLYRSRGRREGHVQHACALEVLALIDPVTGAPPRAPERIDYATYIRRFGALPARVPLPHERTRTLPIFPAYQPFVLGLPESRADLGKPKRGRPPLPARTLRPFSR